MQIDRAALEERLDDLTELYFNLEYDGSPEMDEVANEMDDLMFIKELAYLEDEGFIQIDDEGRCFPIGEATVLDPP